MNGNSYRWSGDREKDGQGELERGGKKRWREKRRGKGERGRDRVDKGEREIISANPTVSRRVKFVSKFLSALTT